MKSRPILFSAPMVRAILDGSKTQTRRIIKPQPKNIPILAEYGLTHGADPAKDGAEWLDADCINPGVPMRGPYGDPGDQLWVKETWRTQYANETQKPIYITEGDPIRYEADENETCSPLYGWGRIRQSIFMRRWMSRLHLEITGIRVERLQDISESDAAAEGCVAMRYIDKGDSFFSTRNAYRELWESINGPGSWAQNPFVWVIEFQRTPQP